MPDTVLPLPLQKLHRGTSLADPFPRTGTPPNREPDAGAKLQCVM